MTKDAGAGLLFRITGAAWAERHWSLGILNAFV